MTTVSDLLATAQPGTAWILDPDRSTVRVRNKTFWGAVPVKGTFSDIEGAGEITAMNTVAGHVRVGAASVSTGIGKRDDHLRSADFFEVENHPVISIDVHGATVTGADTLDLDATLTIKGIERRLVLPATVKPLGDGSVRITAKAEISRKDFGVDGNMAGMIPDATRLEGDAVFTPRPADAP
jgi:polyisoprenoid-binding protein YceI